MKKAKVLVPAVGLQLRFLGDPRDLVATCCSLDAGCQKAAKGPTPPAAF